MTTHPACICPHAERPLGRLYGISMGRAMVRLSTTRGCPVHDTCGSCGTKELTCYQQRESKGYGKDRVWLKLPCCTSCTHLYPQK